MDYKLQAHLARTKELTRDESNTNKYTGAQGPSYKEQISSIRYMLVWRNRNMIPQIATSFRSHYLHSDIHVRSVTRWSA